ncbi:MAG: hypothetical protein ACI9DC_004800 [Gammaproteobacteria bacterium]|jgi:hypothetical protein
MSTQLFSLSLTGGFTFAIAEPVSTPEPATTALLAFGLLGAAGFARRNRNR